MKIGEFVKSCLESKYVGKRIKNWDCSGTFVVSKVSVTDGGVDPQWEIILHSDFYEQMSIEAGEWQKTNNPNGGNLAPKELNDRWRSGFRECYTLNYCNSNLPEVVVEKEEEEEEELDLDNCEQCGERAWDGYICHICGAKNI